MDRQKSAPDMKSNAMYNQMSAHAYSGKDCNPLFAVPQCPGRMPALTLKAPRQMPPHTQVTASECGVGTQYAVNLVGKSFCTGPGIPGV